MNAMTYGLDIAKSAFQLYWVDPASGELHNRRFQRKELIEFLATCPAGNVALEACGGPHWLAPKIQRLAHPPGLSGRPGQSPWWPPGPWP